MKKRENSFDFVPTNQTTYWLSKLVVSKFGMLAATVYLGSSACKQQMADHMRVCPCVTLAVEWDINSKLRLCPNQSKFDKSQ